VLGQVAGERIPREDAIGRAGCATVRVAVADVDHRLVAGQVGPLTGLAARAAGIAVAKRPAPPVRMPLDLVRAHLELEALRGEDRLDQLPEVARDDHRPEPLGELAEAGTQIGVLDEPRLHLLERRLDPFGIPADLLVQRDLTALERLRRVEVDLPVAELGHRLDQRVLHRRRAVPVDDDHAVVPT
jgi:hypothetical protein